MAPEPLAGGRPARPLPAPILPALAVAAVSAACFAALALWVAGGGGRAFDEALLLVFRDPADLSVPLGPAWLHETARDITALGSDGVVGLVLFAIAGQSLLAGRRRAAVLAAVAVGGGLLLASLLKGSIDRPRPALVPHLTEVFTTSFPSSHAMMSAVAYFTLGALLTRVRPGGPAPAYVMTSAAAVVFLVGVSRVYLGVHWPTDVMAGWSAGTAWAALCWAGFSWRGRAADAEVSASGG